MILDTIYEQLSVKKEPFSWVRDEPTDDDIRHIRKSGEPSRFDTLGLRFKMLEDLGSGKAKLICKSGPFAKVLAVVYPGTEIPWDVFAKIFQAFGRSKKDSWRIVWFANPTKRQLPDTFVEPDESNVNGGYTFACEPSTIVIYRQEEVCRVLVHELLHAACTDDMNHPEHIREVLTETWAELFLIGIVAKSKKDVKRLWNIQAQWIADQEQILMKYNVNSHESYAWRYTVGRRAVLEKLGIPLPKAKNLEETSLRFTSPQVLL